MKSSWLSGFLSPAKFMIGLLLTAVVTASVTSYVNRADNVELALKNQQLVQLQKFQESGADLDTAFGAFNDALSDNSKIGAARAQLRLAISRHAADAHADEGILGPDVRTYMDRIADFRDLVDDATRPANAMPMAHAGLQLIKQRQELVSAAEARIGSPVVAEKSASR